jgi:hypothetical protein
MIRQDIIEKKKSIIIEHVAAEALRDLVPEQREGAKVLSARTLSEDSLRAGSFRGEHVWIFLKSINKNSMIFSRVRSHTKRTV